MRPSKFRFDGIRLIETRQPQRELPVSARANSVDALFAPPTSADPDRQPVPAADLTADLAVGRASPSFTAEQLVAAGLSPQQLAALGLGPAPSPLDHDGDGKPGGSQPHPPTENLDAMTKEQLGTYIATNGGTPPASNAVKGEFLAVAKEVAAKVAAEASSTGA